MLLMVCNEFCRTWTIKFYLSTVHTGLAVGAVPTHEIETSQLEGANPLGEGAGSSAKVSRLLTPQGQG